MDHEWRCMDPIENGNITLLLLMVQKSGKLTSWGTGSLSYYLRRALYIQTVVVWDFWTINSMIEDSMAIKIGLIVGSWEKTLQMLYSTTRIYL